jgi:hypothetical protein
VSFPSFDLGLELSAATLADLGSAERTLQVKQFDQYLTSA